MNDFKRVEMIDVKDEGLKKLAEKTQEEVREKAMENLKDADSFIVISLNRENHCIEVRSAVTGKETPVVVGVLMELTQQFISEVFKRGYPSLIMELVKILHEAKPTSDDAKGDG